MEAAAIPLNESARLDALRSYNVLDTKAEKAFDDLTRLAAEICGTPIALVSLVDESRQWFKSHHGLDATETPREVAFCAHAILDDEIFEVSDACQDERFADNPLVTGQPNIRFYAGTVLTSEDKHNVGTLCVIDQKPRELSAWQRECLRTIGHQVETLLELKRHSKEKDRLYDAHIRHSNWTTRRREDLAHFSYRSSHDLRAPAIQIEELIRLSVDDIRSGKLDSAERNLQMMSRSSDKLLAFIDGVVDLGRAELLSDATRRIDFDKLFREVIEQANQQHPGHQVDIRTRVDSIAVFHSEYARLKHMLLQLLTNSIRYSNPAVRNPGVTLGVADCAGELMITVEDNGLGIPAHLHDQYFDMFRRFHPEVCSGSGVGTSIVRKHADALQGNISLHSDSKGTTVSIRLPLTQSAEFSCAV